MHCEKLLLSERLVAAVEGISDYLSEIRKSLNDINTNVSYLVTEKRRTDMPNLRLLPNTIEQSSIDATDVPPATTSDKLPVYIGSADTCFFGDDIESVDIDEDVEPEDVKYLPVEDKTSVDTHSLRSICSVNNDGKHDATSFEKAFQPTMKEEPSNLEGNFSLNVERSCGNTRTVMEVEQSLPADSLDYVPVCVQEGNEIPQKIKEERVPADGLDNYPLCVQETNEILEERRHEESTSEIRNPQSISNVKYNPHSIINPDCSNEQGKFSSSNGTMMKSNRPSLKEVSWLKKMTKLERTNEEKNEESFGSASCLLSLGQLKTEFGFESASLESAVTQIGTESEGSETREDQRSVREEASGRRDEGSSSLLETLSTHDRGQVNCKKSVCCQICGKCFPNSWDLQRHKIVHTGEKPFKCSYCYRGFALKGNLAQHLRIHTGERPFSCSVCGMTFRYSSNVHVHMRKHTNEKSFTCTVCKKAFPQKFNLKLHMHIHMGEKPFKCSLCGRGFAQNNHLLGHMRIHTGGQPF